MMKSLNIRIGRLNECTLDQIVMLKTRGFEGYKEQFGLFRTTSGKQESITRQRLMKILSYLVNHHICPDCSVVAFVDEKPVGFVFIAFKTVQQKKLAWNGGTGVFPEYRGQGIAKAMMRKVEEILQDEQIDQALLEVVVQNKNAIAAYENAGFTKIDQLSGLSHAGALNAPFSTRALDRGWRVIYDKPEAVSKLNFYRNNAAWGCMWHNLNQGKSVILYDADREPLAYALFSKTTDAKRNLETIELYQCEACSTGSDPETLYRWLLDEVFGPFDSTFLRKTVNLSMATKDLIDILKEAGFTTEYEQYLMIR